MEVLSNFRLSQFVEVLDQLPLGIAPGKISVGLCETQLGQSIHNLGASEGLRQEYNIRAGCFDLGNQPFPERKGFCMGVIYAKDANTLFDPEDDDTFEFVPELLPVLGLELEGINILVFLRWVLGVLYSVIRAPAEPFRVSLHVGMVRRTLKGDIQRDFDVMFAGLGHEALEILQRAKFWMN